MDKCKKCGKEIKKGDWDITFGKINHYDGDIPVATQSEINYYCKKCYKPTFRGLLIVHK